MNLTKIVLAWLIFAVILGTAYVIHHLKRRQK